MFAVSLNHTRRIFLVALVIAVATMALLPLPASTVQTAQAQGDPRVDPRHITPIVAETGGGCAVASIAMVLNWLGASVSFRNVWDYNGGDYIGDWGAMARLRNPPAIFNDYGYPGGYSVRDIGLGHINADLDRGIPVIVGGDNWGGLSTPGPHWVVVTHHVGNTYYGVDVDGQAKTFDPAWFDHAKAYYADPETPSITYPTPGGTVNSASFTVNIQTARYWGGSADYHVQIDDDAQFGSPEVDLGWPSTTAIAVTVPGPGQWYVRARQGNSWLASAMSAPVGFTVAAPTGTPPSLTSAASVTVAVNTLLSHTFTSSGDPAPALSYSNENLPSGVTRTGDMLSGAPTIVGTYGLRVTASNSAGSASQDFVIHVTGDAPSFTSATSISATVNQPLSHTFTAAGNPAPTLTYSNENLPPGVTRTADTISGTPSAAGTYSIDVLASNGSGADAQQTLTIEVASEPPARDPSTAPASAPVVFPAPPPALRLVDHNFVENSPFRGVVPDVWMHDVYAKPIIENGQFPMWLGNPLTHFGTVGSRALVDMRILQAVDVFSPSGLREFSDVVVCLRGEGRIFLLADTYSTAPRVPEEATAWTTDAFPGYTCATLYRPATVVLVSWGE